MFKNLIQRDKKSVVLVAVAITATLFMLIGATYAYFAAQAGGGTSADINAITGTTDSLSFSVEKDINLHVTMDDFQEGMESPHGETTATATLKANNVTNQATGRYNVFFIIDNNNFEYSTEDGKTELLLKVIDPNGNEVMDITGLKRVEDGFDITTRIGGFLIMADYDIEATPEKTLESQTWKLEVTFINLDSDQNINKGKSLNGRFYITTEKESTYELAKINSIEATTTYNSITANLSSLPGTEEIDKYYYAIEEDTSDIAYLGAGVSVARLSNSMAIRDTDYIESDESTHIFENLKPSTKYKVYSYAKDKQGVSSNVYETSITTAEYELPKVTNLVHSETLTSISVTATAESGSNEVSKYYFSKDNGATWSEGQTSNSYTFDNLLDTTEYKIKVKVEDTNGIYSTEYYEAISTTAYINPSVTKVSNTKTYNSISLTTTATGGTNNVAKYYYKVGTGSWSEAQTTNTYGIIGLSENTTYTIYVKVEDTNGRVSNEYTLEVTTNTYVVPRVSATTSKTSSSITINATGTKGDGTIAKYMYSKDGGSNWITQNSTSTSDSYTFSGLTSNTTYQIRVKVVDNNNRESTVYSTSVTTDYVNPSVSITSTSKTSNSITVYYSGTAGSKAISYYQVSCNGGTSYNTSYTTSYTCTGLSGSTTYQIRVRAVDTGGVTGSYKSTSVTTNASITLANYIKSLYTSQGGNNLYYHISSLAYSANDASYRYTSPSYLSNGVENNFVCFGSSATTCSSENLYRIIGVFGDQVKLIKEVSIGDYYWSGSSSNTSNAWANSTLNTSILNGTYLNGLGTTWSNKIATTVWQVGGTSWSADWSIKQFYDYEVGINKFYTGSNYTCFSSGWPTTCTINDSTTYSAKIGLLYASDYFYSIASDWSVSFASASTSTSWLNYLTPNYSSLDHPYGWTISRRLDYIGKSSAWTIGFTFVSNDTYSVLAAVHPTFYLNSSVLYLSGTGTQSDPYRIS